jgi:hypothetical protein
MASIAMPKSSDAREVQSCSSGRRAAASTMASWKVANVPTR